jgi:hypothetical protein
MRTNKPIMSSVLAMAALLGGGLGSIPYGGATLMTQSPRSHGKPLDINFEPVRRGPNPPGTKLRKAFANHRATVRYGRSAA